MRKFMYQDPSLSAKKSPTQEKVTYVGENTKITYNE